MLGGKLGLLGLGIALQQPDNGRVALGALDELLQTEFAVFVAVHLSEDFVGAFLRRALVLRHFHHRTNHFVYRLQQIDFKLAQNPATKQLTVTISSIS